MWNRHVNPNPNPKPNRNSNPSPSPNSYPTPTLYFVKLSIISKTGGESGINVFQCSVKFREENKKVLADHSTRWDWTPTNILGFAWRVELHRVTVEPARKAMRTETKQRNGMSNIVYYGTLLSTHDDEPWENWMVKVRLLLGVLYDFCFYNRTSHVKFQRGRRHIRQFKLLHVPHPPAQNLRNHQNIFLREDEWETIPVFLFSWDLTE